MNEPKKTSVVTALRAQLREEMDALAAALNMARDEATHGESRPENEYDTRATEASYLAAGQGQRFAELKQLRDWYEALDPTRACVRVEPGALVCVEDERERHRWLFVAPTGGSLVRVAGVDVRVVSPASPLGGALAGLGEGDDTEVDGPAGDQTLIVVRVR